MNAFDTPIEIFKSHVHHLAEDGSIKEEGASTQIHESYDDSLTFVTTYNEQVSGKHASRAFVGMCESIPLRTLMSYEPVDFQGMHYYYLPAKYR